MDTSNKSDLHMDQGFISKPYARKKLIRGPNGTVQVVFEDVRTGKQVNPQGYTIIQSDNSLDNTSVNVTQGETLSKNQNNSNNSTDKTASEEILHDHGKDSVTTNAKDEAGSSYFNKPGWMGFTSFIPGPLGLVGKLANVGANVNNMEAINKQKEALGFSKPTTTQNIGSVLSDKQGYIGDLSTTRTDGTKSTAPVSFEAEDANHRTALTPNEARMREQLSNAVPATDEEKKAAIGTFNNEFPDQNKSFFGGLISSAKGLFSGIFGGTSSPTTGSGQTSNGGQSTNNSGFPDRPDRPDGQTNDSMTDRDHQNQNGGYSSPGLF